MLIEVHYRIVESSMIELPNSSNGSIEHKVYDNVRKGEQILINLDKIEVVREKEYRNRNCADVFFDESNPFQLYESMNEIAAMASCVRSFK